METSADTWLVEVDRRALPTYLSALADTGVAASAELGEAVRRLRFPEPVGLEVVTSPGWARFALAVEWEGDEAGFALAFPGRPVAARALRRHDRFLASRLATGGADAARAGTLHAAVSAGRIFAGTTLADLPRRAGDAAAGPSRAGEKLAEGLAWLEATGHGVSPGSHWLELGAFPGGMTTELVRRGHRVTALDVHPPSERMRQLPGVRFVTGPAEAFSPTETYDGLLCDVNGSPGRVARTVADLAAHLAPGGILIHTLKLPRWDAAERLRDETETRLRQRGLLPLGARHLRQNRQELTLFAVRLAKEPHGDLRDR